MIIVLTINTVHESMAVSAKPKQPKKSRSKFTIINATDETRIMQLMESTLSGDPLFSNPLEIALGTHTIRKIVLRRACKRLKLVAFSRHVISTLNAHKVVARTQEVHLACEQKRKGKRVTNQNGLLIESALTNDPQTLTCTLLSAHSLKQTLADNSHYQVWPPEGKSMNGN
jgi:hypothetical protein